MTPTYYSSQDVAALWFDNWNMGSTSDSARIKIAAVTQPFTAFGSTWPTAVDTGTRNGEFEVSGYYDGASSAGYGSTMGTDRVITVLLEGNTLGKRFYGFQAAQVESYEIQMAPDDYTKQSVSMACRGEVNFGHVVAPAVNRTTAGNTQATYLDVTTQQASGHAFFHCTAIGAGGGNGVTVTVQHSTDGNIWVDHTAFTKRSTVGAQVVELSSAVEHCIAIKWAWDGGSNQSFTGFVGVAFD